MANGAIWNQMDVEIRKIFVTSGLVEAVILLPGQLLPGTALAVTMMVFSHGNKSVKMIDASDFYTKGRRKNTLEDKDIERILEAYNQPSEKSKKITIEVLEQQDYILNPQRYLDITDDKWDKYLLLGDICKTVNRGAVIRSAELNKIASKTPTSFQYLMLQNIKNGQISTELPYITKLDEQMDKYCIKNGNLIISKISPFKIAMVHVNGDKKILANGNLYFLEIDATKINPVYLMLYLQSERGMIELNMYSKGSVMQTISMQELKKVRVPDIPLEEQSRIVSEYQDLADELVIISKQEEIIKEKMVHLMQEVF
jgi:type I restriction enzyme M protein